ncbi:hypothetical protein ACPOL_1548 [Acidisarcina polymorpha]|uniref:Uncharacterized protein n=1 Tax=Acidisarcina polymorpha TaxID=2211140 RepID=A0A2Z5FWK3_9BACT|nr:hypothetical protein ACPOL_1548 [Acidisarcina polymorpha]
MRLFSPPKHPVLSLAVQAALFDGDPQERSQFQVLVRHFLDRFFTNETTSSDGETKARALQIAYAIALPGLCVAIYLFPPYHYPGGRPFWLQISDHYFYVMYSFVAIGAITIFVWDFFFPDLLDVFVLSTLSIQRQTLFWARVSAVVLFLGIFLLGANALGSLFFPASADLPSLARHFFAHLVAVTMSGAFIAAFFLALQGSLLTLLGERISRTISPFLQGLSVTGLLTMLLIFPIVSRFLEALLSSGGREVQYFPPFWFLGIYERLLRGSSTLPVFATLARTGWIATAFMIAMASLFYPFAYRSRMRHVVEGADPRNTQNRILIPLTSVLHKTLLRIPQRRAIFHFISQTLLRTPRYRVYLTMYGGGGMALVIAGVVMLKLGDGHISLVFSPDGLRAAIPIIAFWTIAGLRAAFLGPADRKVNWIFRVINGKPGWDESTATRWWVLLWALILTLGSVTLIHAIAPPGFNGWSNTGVQVFVGISLCLLLTDAFFLNVKMVPFTGARPASTTNLAFVLIQYFGLFPPLVLLTLGLEDWLLQGLGHLLIVAALVVGAHFELLRRHRRIVTDFLGLIEVDEEEEEFPQRLGLRY